MLHLFLESIQGSNTWKDELMAIVAAESYGPQSIHRLNEDVISINGNKEDSDYVVYVITPLTITLECVNSLIQDLNQIPNHVLVGILFRDITSEKINDRFERVSVRYDDKTSATVLSLKNFALFKKAHVFDSVQDMAEFINQHHRT